MMVGMFVAPVVRRADHATERQTTPFKVPPETHVESNIAVVRVNVQVTVLVRPVFYDERMC